jgi:hypothetical protein
MNIIRKISVGADLKSALHYQVGIVTFKGKTISDIIINENFFDVYLQDEDCKLKWKSFSVNAVSHIEYNINE